MKTAELKCAFGYPEGRRNERGNLVLESLAGGERYVWDSVLMPSGWEQYDTTSDAAYFGVWVHLEDRATFCFAEGDLILVLCDSDEAFEAELDSMADFYGRPPPFATVIDLEARQMTKIVATRPGGNR